MKKTAVLILGFHVDSKLRTREESLDWHDLVIGSIGTGYATGRATHGLLLAWREQADTIMFSTGASEKDGLKEAEYTYRETVKVLPALAACLGTPAPSLHAWLTERVSFDTESRTTAEEIKRNLFWCVENERYSVTLVTNQFHAPRALALANQVICEHGLTGLRVNVQAPNDGTPAPVIFEPPTRPDRSGLDWHGLLSKIFDLPAHRQADAFAEISAILKR